MRAPQSGKDQSTKLVSQIQGAKAQNRGRKENAASLDSLRVRYGVGQPATDKHRPVIGRLLPWAPRERPLEKLGADNIEHLTLDTVGVWGCACAVKGVSSDRDQ